jgi:hypothetical protein
MLTMGKTRWVVTCGQVDDSGCSSILRDSFPGEGSFYLVFSSKEGAEREAKSMNRLRSGLKLSEIYTATKLKEEWLDGLPARQVD